MEQTEQPDLFETKVNATGKMYIRKFAVAARQVLLVGIILSIVVVTENIIRFIKFSPSDYSHNKAVQIQLLVFPYFSLIYTVLLLFQLYYYWKVGRCLRNGVDYANETTFNESFGALYRNAVLGIITLSMGVVMDLLNLYILIKL